MIALDELQQAQRQERLDAWTNLAKPAQGLGQLVVKDSQSGSPVRLNVARYHAHVVLQPPAALVQIDQSFYNPYDRQEEGTFVFSLPRGASVSRFAMYVAPGQLVEGEVIERQRAAGVYQSIVSRQRDPAILEQIGDNLFKMRMFPIFPKDVKRILLDYTVPLESVGGACSFRLPLFSDLQPIWDFRISGVIDAAAAAKNAMSLSHPATVFRGRADGAIAFELGARLPTAVRLPPELHRSGPAASRRAQLHGPSRKPGRPGLISWPFSVACTMYFQASIPPGVGDAQSPNGKARAKTAEPPADVLVLADTSVEHEELQTAAAVAGDDSAQLAPSDRFRLMCVDVAAHPLGGGWRPAGGADVETALAEYDRQFCLGGTNLAKGVCDAAAAFETTAPAAAAGGLHRRRGEHHLPRRRAAKKLADGMRDANACFCGVIVSGGKQADLADQPPAAAAPAAPPGLGKSDDRWPLEPRRGPAAG